MQSFNESKWNNGNHDIPDFKDYSCVEVQNDDPNIIIYNVK